jgi:hypothetical protein
MKIWANRTMTKIYTIENHRINYLGQKLSNLTMLVTCELHCNLRSILIHILIRMFLILLRAMC